MFDRGVYLLVDCVFGSYLFGICIVWMNKYLDVRELKYTKKDWNIALSSCEEGRVNLASLVLLVHLYIRHGGEST